MTTGDLKNNLRKLVSELKQVHYPQSELDLKGIAQGLPKAFLPVVHHVFLDYSIDLAQYFATKEYELYGKTDLRFMEAVYKVLRDEFGYKPEVTKEQFLTIGFAERKIISLCAILKLLRGKDNELNPKNNKSEKKKGKSGHSSQQLTSGRNTEKEIPSVKGSTTSCDYFPGPLPVDTDMKSFRNNKEATEGGLGLTEPLVTRMIHEEDCINTKGNIKPSSRTAAKDGSSNKKNSSVENSFLSNLVVRSVSDEGHFGVKFPVSRNLEIRANLSRQPQVKTVTWEDQVEESQVGQNEANGEIPQALYCGPIAPISVPAKIHSIPYSEKSPTYYSLELETATGITTRPHTIPSPVSMTTVPTPSPDLMLTPVVKNTQREAIPLSSSHKESDLQVYRAPVSNNNLPGTKVVRHSNSSETVSHGSANLICAEDESQVYVLKQQVQELQEKFDAMVLLNSEMSARVVLLESRMKLLEEACEKKSCCNCCKNHSPTINKENTSRQVDHTVVSGFNVRGDKDSAESILTHASTNEQISNWEANVKSVLKHNVTNRKLFTEIAMPSDSGDHGFKESWQDDTSFDSDKSDDKDEGSGKENCMNSERTPDKSKTVSSSEQNSSIFISPLPSASKISEVFADSATKNTVVNVHKRLQETRELLARTNRDFAAKFNRYQLE